MQPLQHILLLDCGICIYGNQNQGRSAIWNSDGELMQYENEHFLYITAGLGSTF